MSDEFPPFIGKYKVLGIIAKGGMGVIYKAIHPSLKRYVVIKKMTVRGRAHDAERFKKEAQILLDLQSPYIVHLFDYFTEAGFRYIVEELVDGKALDALLKKQKALPVPVAMLLMQDSCFALKYAHSKNIIHRDIKPGNILISKRGEIKLADFGIASDANEADEVNKTQTGVALGTPAYMPPEQFEDASRVDERADIYALGIMLYEMITGCKPYPGNFSLDALNTIKKGKYINPRKLDKSIPRFVCRLIKKMIKPNPKKRFGSVDSVIKRIKKYLSHYDTHELRVQLAKSVMIEGQYEFTVFEPKDKLKRKIRSIFISVILVALVFIFCWNQGFIHKTILRRWVTPVSVEMTMPASLLNTMDLPVKAFFFENDNKDIPEVLGSQRTFAVKGTRLSEKLFIFGNKTEIIKPSDKNKTYTMKDVYLKHGDYRVKVVVGPYVWWKSFSVGKENVDITCDFLKNTRRNLKIKPYVYDAKTGEDITLGSDVKILYNNIWTNLDAVDYSKIESGTVWKIKATAEGYSEEYFSLLIDWFQDELIICAALNKI